MRRSKICGDTLRAIPGKDIVYAKDVNSTDTLGEQHLKKKKKKRMEQKVK